MALAFRSQTTNTVANNHTLTINKPAGLAVNDIMIAHHVTGNCGSQPPAGWTEFNKTAQGDATSAVYWKLADSSDVAASNFSFTEDLCGSADQSGAILAFSGGDTVDPVSPSSVNKNNTGTTITTTTITPDEANTIILLFVAPTSKTVTVSSPAIATDDPGGWVEAYDGLPSTGGANFKCAGYYSGIRSQTSATGNGQVTLSSSVQWILHMVAINPGATATNSSKLLLLGIG